MSDSTPRIGGRRVLLLAALVGLVAGIAGGWLGGRLSGGEQFRAYLLAHPEVLPEAMAALRDNDNTKALAGIRSALEKPYPGAVLGNPAGRVTLVLFSDFACGYCRRSVADIDALVAANRDLRVVVRELPILSAESADAARMALAAARQGRFAAFHQAMFAAGQVDAATIEAAARAAGVDLAQARRDLADPVIKPGIAAEIEGNQRYAEQLRLDGTPGWTIGNEIHNGAVGRDVLARAIARARS